jgi:hypothetical protein
LEYNEKEPEMEELTKLDKGQDRRRKGFVWTKQEYGQIWLDNVDMAQNLFLKINLASE